MEIWKNESPQWVTPPDHFGGLTSTDIVPFAGRNFAVQISNVPPGGGGELHHHDDWAQVFYIVAGQLTFDTGNERFTLVAGQSVLFDPKDPHYTLNEGDGDTTALVMTIAQD